MRVAMVVGEITSNLHPNIQGGPCGTPQLGVSVLIMAGDNITTGESMMAKRIKHTPWTQGTHRTTSSVKAQPPLDGYQEL